MSEQESELDRAIIATIAIGILDGTHKRERIAKSIERLLLAARAEFGTQPQPDDLSLDDVVSTVLEEFGYTFDLGGTQ